MLKEDHKRRSANDGGVLAEKLGASELGSAVRRGLRGRESGDGSGRNGHLLNRGSRSRSCCRTGISDRNGDIKLVEDPLAPNGLRNPGICEAYPRRHCDYNPHKNSMEELSPF